MTKLNKKHKSQSKSKTLTAAQGDLDNADTGWHIDAWLLVKRVNSLVVHVSHLDGADEAEKNARETTAHVKNIKEIMALNESLKDIQDVTQKSRGYTPEEEQALAQELATLIIKNGGFS